MAYFSDLSPYNYLEISSEKKCLNIGWLSGEVEFPKGRVKEETLEKLRVISESLNNLTRGVHYCEFCEPPVFSPRGENFVCTLIKDAPHGNGEIWVESADGVTYVAPALLIHYIEEHSYRPPKEFLQVVENNYYE